jgi:hypothetical protein
MQIYSWQKSRFLLQLMVACSLAAGTALLAQLQDGRIVGIVSDPQHAVVPGATVTVTNTGTNISETVTTDTSGNYVVTPLDPGAYTVSAVATGFQTTVRNGIELTVGQSAEVDLGLVIGATATRVEVNTTTPMLSTESGSLGQVISNTQVVDLPLNGRTFTELAQLSPGAVFLAATGNTQNVRPEAVNGNVISGISGQQTVFLLDGADVTEYHEGGTYIQTSIDALQEFSVEQNSYSAEFSGGGGTFNSTTKSGTNQFHGDLFEFLRNEKFDARNFFALQRNELKRNQFGATLGGPLSIPKIYSGKDRTFFFLSYEGERQLQGNVTVTPVPSVAQRNGDFSAAGLKKIYDPLTTAAGTRTQFPGNMIPQNRFVQPALYFNQFIPFPNSGTNYVSNPVSDYDDDKVVIRLDQTINANNKLFARYSTDRNRETDFAAFPALGSSYLQGPATNIAGALTTTLGTKVVNELVLSHLGGQYRSTAYFQGQGVNQDTAAGIDPSTLAGLQNPATSTFPIFTFSGYIGTVLTGQVNDGRPKSQNRAMYELADSLSWVKGKQILKFGTRITRRSAELIDSRTSDGSFTYSGIMTQNPASSAGTGDAFADWMLGYPANASRGNYATYWGGIGTYWHFYAQDDWKVSETLTLNLGLRYEYSPWMTPYRGQGAGFDPTQAQPIIVSSRTDQIDLNAQPDAALGYQLYGQYIQTTHQAGLPLTVTNKDRLQFAPRFGFAWRPFGEKTVFRGGFGQFFQVESTNVRLNFNFLPFALVETTTALTNVVPVQTTANFFQGAAFGAGLSPAKSPVAWSPLPTHAKVAVDPHWSLGFQRQLPGAMILGVDYVGTEGLNLPGTLNINDPPAGPGSVQARRPYPNYGTISYNNQSSLSTYNSLQAKLQKQTSHGYWYLLSYTFSKSITNQEVPAMGGNGFFNRGLSTFDVPQNFTVSGGYALPFGRGKRFLGSAGRFTDEFVGGWQFQTITNFHSGVPYTPTVSRDVANIGVASQHPNLVGPGCRKSGSLKNYFILTDFAVPANYTFGNSGTDTCRGGSFEEVDMSLFKDFAITEGTRLQFRAEAFNIPNSAYFNIPSTTTVDTSNGGQVTSTANQNRQLQFALKYVF